MSKVTFSEANLKEIEPLADVVIVSPLKKDEKTPGGVHLPDNARRSFDRGVVIGVGPDVSALTNGDVVFLPDHGGHQIEMNGKDFLFYREEDIPAKEGK